METRRTTATLETFSVTATRTAALQIMRNYGPANREVACLARKSYTRCTLVTPGSAIARCENLAIQLFPKPEPAAMAS